MDVEEMRSRIEAVNEFEGNGCAVAYRARGHVDKDVFRQALLLEFGVTVSLEAIEHSHCRNIPAGPDMPGLMFYQPSKPGRGAYPVTEVDASMIVEVG